MLWPQNYTYTTPRGHCMDCGKPTQWLTLSNQGAIHAFTTCHFASEMFMGEPPYTLIPVGFLGVDTLFMSRLAGADPPEAHIGMNVEAQYLRNSKFRVTDVYFVSTENR